MGQKVTVVDVQVVLLVDVVVAVELGSGELVGSGPSPPGPGPGSGSSGSGKSPPIHHDMSVISNRPFCLFIWHLPPELLGPPHPTGFEWQPKRVHNGLDPKTPAPPQQPKIPHCFPHPPKSQSIDPQSVMHGKGGGSGPRNVIGLGPFPGGFGVGIGISTVGSP